MFLVQAIWFFLYSLRPKYSPWKHTNESNAVVLSVLIQWGSHSEGEYRNAPHVIVTYSSSLDTGRSHRPPVIIMKLKPKDISFPKKSTV